MDNKQANKYAEIEKRMLPKHNNDRDNEPLKVGNFSDNRCPLPVAHLVPAWVESAG